MKMSLLFTDFWAIKDVDEFDSSAKEKLTFWRKDSGFLGKQLQSNPHDPADKSGSPLKK